VNANKTWRSYAESLPSVGYLGGDVYPYFRHHNPFTYFSDVQGTSQAGNVVPFSQFAADLSAGTLPNFAFIVPKALHDAHDGNACGRRPMAQYKYPRRPEVPAAQNGGSLS